MPGVGIRGVGVTGQTPLARAISLLRGSKAVYWRDPSDLSTLFQDSAGTTPVTAVEQPVGRILDKSGNGRHFIQATPASRPILKQDSNGCYYLNFDGVDDSQASAATVDLTGTDKITVVGAWHKASDAAQGILVETSSAVSSNNGAFLIAAPTAAGLAGYDLTSKGTTAVQAYSGSSFPAPHTAVLSAIGDISGDRATLRVNGVQRVQATGDQGTGNYGNHTVFVGSRAGSSLRFNGREYGHALFNTTLSASELAAVEAYFRAKSRAY